MQIIIGLKFGSGHIQGILHVNNLPTVFFLIKIYFFFYILKINDRKRCLLINFISKNMEVKPILIPKLKMKDKQN